MGIIRQGLPRMRMRAGEQKHDCTEQRPYVSVVSRGLYLPTKRAVVIETRARWQEASVVAAVSSAIRFCVEIQSLAGEERSSAVGPRD